MDDDKKKLADALADIADLKKQVENLTSAPSRRDSEIQLAGPFVSGAPTADGYVDFMIAGKRYKILVDAY